MSLRLDDKPHIDFNIESNILTIQSFNNRDSVTRKMSKEDAISFLRENGISDFTADQIVNEDFIWQTEDEKAKNMIKKLVRFRKDHIARKLF